MSDTFEDEALDALNRLIRKSRVHLYKPIQIAEILYQDRIFSNLDLLDLETYRSKSKAWRDRITLKLTGSRSTSSAKFQDDLFSESAISPNTLLVLGNINRATKGGVEAYIYNQYMKKQDQIRGAISYCRNSLASGLNLREFYQLFWKDPGLKRSIDKIYEIVAYALFLVAVEEVDLYLTPSIADSCYLLRNKSLHLEVVQKLTTNNQVKRAAISRIGATNAADRGIDIITNFGPVIQVKHLELTKKLLDEILASVSANEVVVVCKSVSPEVREIVNVGAAGYERLVAVFDEEELIKYSELIRKTDVRAAQRIVSEIIAQLEVEFPATVVFDEFYLSREYQHSIDISSYIKENN